MIEVKFGSDPAGVVRRAGEVLDAGGAKERGGAGHMRRGSHQRHGTGAHQLGRSQTFFLRVVAIFDPFNPLG